MHLSRSRRALATFVGLALLALPLAPAGAAPGLPVAVDSNVLGCDPLDPAACLLPFPNNLFTAPADTDTGLRINFLPTAMPRNGTELTEGGEGKPVDPTEWNRNDGFSPGSMVMTSVPGIDLHQTWGTADRPYSTAGINTAEYFDHRDHIADIGLYREPGAPMVIINTETGERHPFWSELDQHPGAVAEGDQVLIMRPATNFEEGTRYVVALRDLKDASGAVIGPRDEFVAYRDGSGADAARQSYFDSAIFSELESAGIARDNLYLAWDFTVASERNLAERMLHMRDDAFAQLGDTDLADGIVQGESPEFMIDRQEVRTDSWTDSRGVQRQQQIRRVHGRVVVPNYLDRIQQTEGHVRGNQLPYDAPVPGSRLLDTNLDGLPDQNPVESTVNVPFTCDYPLNGKANKTVLYGHGLLGDRSQLGDLKSPRRSGAPFGGCAADFWGMSTPDLPTVAAILGDLSNFPSLPDRAQQGFLNFMFLGRAAVHPNGFVTDPAFQQDNAPMIEVADENSTPLYYDGNSQGGIMGAPLIAVSPDIQRGILGVVGMNYSTLLNRSVDWEGELALEADIPAYSVPYYESYRDPIERQIGFSLIQMLWDRGEGNGYAHHLTDDPYANTPKHDVMLQVAWSDHQVANVSAEVEARTAGAPIMVPGLPDGKHWEMDPYFSETATYPYKGSSLIYWDSGNGTPPNGNLPPQHLGDPHGHPRDEPAAAWQEAHFLLTGWNEDVCQGGDYLTRRNPVNGGTASCLEPLRAPGTFQEGPEDPQPTESTLAFSDSQASSGQYSDEAAFEVTLTDAESGEAITGAPVTIELHGADSSETFEVTTDNTGTGRAVTTLDEVPGDYTLVATYAGDEEHLAAEASTPFTVERDDSATSLIVTGKGSKRTLQATLWEPDSMRAFAGETITFFANGTEIGSAVTDEQGVATLQVPPGYRGDSFTFEARWAGNTYYLPSSGTATS
jgi:hypothetical protein